MGERRGQRALEGRKALITGGTSGIGLATARVLHAQGAEVWVVARSAESVEAMTGAGFCGSALDLTRRAAREQLVADISQAWGGLDICVLNAGTNIRKRSVDYSVDEYRSVMDLNLDATFDLACRTHPLLAGRDAAVVLVLSVAGLTHLGTGSPYAMSKAALTQLTRNLAVEWASDRIRVNAVAPWYTRTPLAEQVLSNPEYLRRVLARTPAGRIAEAEEVARPIAFLASDAASYVTGQCLNVDGGFSVYGFDPAVI